MPRALEYTQFLAVPRSIARSVERNDRNDPKPKLFPLSVGGGEAARNENAVFP
jgi:hypothetical protein